MLDTNRELKPNNLKTDAKVKITKSLFSDLQITYCKKYTQQSYIHNLDYTGFYFLTSTFFI